MILVFKNTSSRLPPDIFTISRIVIDIAEKDNPSANMILEYLNALLNSALFNFAIRSSRALIFPSRIDAAERAPPHT